MSKTRNLILGGIVTVGVLAAIGAVTVARAAAKHLDEMSEDDLDKDFECEGDCSKCPMNDEDVDVEIEINHEEKAEEPEKEAPAAEEPAEGII